MAPASPESDIGRARKAIVDITKAIVRQISSVPVNSPLRQEKREIFDTFGALQALHDNYLMEGVPDFKQWSQFWTRSLPVLLELGNQLDQRGYGLTGEELNELYEQEKQERNAK
jgi:hypothetical protein